MMEEISTELWSKLKSFQLQSVLKSVCHILIFFFFFGLQNSSRISKIYIYFTNMLFGTTSPVSTCSNYKKAELLNTKK